jgi:hypothetical protein
MLAKSIESLFAMDLNCCLLTSHETAKSLPSTDSTRQFFAVMVIVIGFREKL